MSRLTTDRLVGDPVQHADVDLAARLFGDPEVARWIWPVERPGERPGPRTPDEAAAIVDRFVARWQDDGMGWWFLRLRATGEFIGEVGLQRADLQGERAVEIGWTLLSERWGRGYATEAATAALAWAFGACGLREVVSFTMPHNVASRRIMEKLGMTYDRDFEHAGLPHVLYRLRASVPAG